MKRNIIVLLVAMALLVGILSGCTETTEEEEEEEEEEEQEEETKNIVETASANDDFETLVTALTAANLVETLQGEGPFTVFAPTDDAFAALNQTWLTNLLSDTTNLTKVLTYHVVSGKVMSTDLSNTTVMTLEGTNITVVVDTTVTINGVNVTTADVECSNGVIHIIGEVLLPDSVTGPTE